MTEAATAQALGVELSDLFAWRAWLARWCSAPADDMPKAAQTAPEAAETAFKPAPEPVP